MEICANLYERSGRDERVKYSVGVSDFEKIRSNGYYYIDKSGLIGELLRAGAEVTLITRPRRFGKTLGMSMLENFFDIRKDSRELFEGLEISERQDLCSKWMNQWPTVFLSLKSVEGLNLKVRISSWFMKFHFYIRNMIIFWKVLL